MATFDIKFVQDNYGGDSESETLENFARADGCYRIYKVAMSPDGDYTDYITIRSPSDEQAMRNSRYVYRPWLVWPTDEAIQSDETVDNAHISDSYEIDIREDSSSYEIEGVIATVTVAEQEIKDAFEKCFICINRSDRFPNLEGILFHQSGNEVNCVATDTHRMSVVSLSDVQLDGSFDRAVIPHSFALELIKEIETGNQKLQIAVLDQQIVFRTSSGKVLRTDSLQGKYPNYWNAIPKNCKATTEVGKKELVNAVTQMLRYVDTRPDKPVVVTIEPNRIILAFTQSSHNSSVQIEAKLVEGTLKSSLLSFGSHKLTLAVNAGYFKDALESIDTNKLHISVTDSTSPLRITPFGDTRYQHVLMPVKLDT